MKTSISSHPIKHVPKRTCIACRQIKDKRELIRLVFSSDEDVEVDITGKKMGRGAYLCSTQGCWEIVLKGDRLERSLKTKLTSENREKLIKFAEGNF